MIMSVIIRDTFGKLPWFRKLAFWRLDAIWSRTLDLRLDAVWSWILQFDHVNLSQIRRRIQSFAIGSCLILSGGFEIGRCLIWDSAIRSRSSIKTEVNFIFSRLDAVWSPVVDSRLDAVWSRRLCNFDHEILPKIKSQIQLFWDWTLFDLDRWIRECTLFDLRYCNSIT